MDHGRRAALLALAGVALVVGTLAVGAVTAPSLGVETDDGRQTIVGSQSTEGGWMEGGAIYLLNGTEEVWREDSAPNYFDVTMLADGRVLAAFSDRENTEGCDPYEPPCHKTGYRIVNPGADGGPEVTGEWSFPVRHETNSEVHAATPVGDDEVVVADMEHERILTVRNGEITWQWNASSYYNAPEDPAHRDWLHVNDVDPIGEDRFLVSVRNANQLLVVERGEGVVEVINEDRGSPDASCLQDGQLVPDEDGDVECGDPDVMDHQHNPQWLADGAVLVADSDNDRVVELHRNETTGHWEPVWALDEAEDVPFHWPRDADRLENGNTLITDTHNSRVVEVTENGSTVWSARTYAIPYEADRLPEGERAGTGTYDVGGEIVAPGSDVPFVSLALAGLKGEFPVIPFWFSELHFVLSIVGTLLVVGGVVERLRAPGGPSRQSLAALTDDPAGTIDRWLADARRSTERRIDDLKRWLRDLTE